MTEGKSYFDPLKIVEFARVFNFWFANFVGYNVQAIVAYRS